MKKVVVSWLATRADFFIKNEKQETVRAEGGINKVTGPHYNLYKHHPDFDIHYLLCQKAEDDENIPVEWEFLANFLRQEFKKEVRFKYMNIADITSVGSLKGKVYDLLAGELKSMETEIFLNPGTPSMQIAWYLTASELRQHQPLKLFRLSEPKHSPNGIPEKKYVTPLRSMYSSTTNLVELKKSHNASKRLFITQSIKPVYERAMHVASNNATTALIQGDSGTGKELIARYIHDHSNRNEQPYVIINCGAIRGDLLESRLFGFLKGAFTGALKNTKGAFEDAQGGTIFLDEIGDITPHMQVALLRVLQERKITRIGSTKEIPVDVRVITATNKNLWDLCLKGKFRYDLYYRLSVVELQIPAFLTFPKKERKEWVNHFLVRKRFELNRDKALKLNKEVWDFLLEYPFHGNIRELENLIENFYIFCEKEVMKEDMPSRLYYEQGQELSLKLDDVIKRHIRKVVEMNQGNILQSARILDVSAPTIRKWLN